MRKAALILPAAISLLFMLSMSTGKSTKAKTILVSGTVLETSDYCGGARPSEDQLHPKPSPARNTKLFIKRSSVNNNGKITDSIITDENGKFSIKLMPGNYCIVEEWKKNDYVVPTDDQFQTYDTACYRKNYMTCDYSLLVKKGMRSPEITLHHHCQWSRPCVQWHGPLPPAANPGGGRIPHNE